MRMNPIIFAYIPVSHTCTFMNYITCVCQAHEINIWSVPFLYTHNTHMYIWEQITASISDVYMYMYIHTSGGSDTSSY